ncbi:MAG: hypothetical protein ABIN67_22985 [Ferruginibacter sp.]
METSVHILKELQDISPLVASIGRVNIFTVPAGYFDSISETVIACLREESRILSASGDTSSLPEGYFENLAGTILDRIKAQQTTGDEIKDLSPLLYAIQNKNVFEVPVGYFEHLSQAIFDRINIVSSKEELQELSPLLYGIQVKNVFEAPVGYFDGLADTIISTVQPRPAKVVNMRSRFAKYAAAAAMIGVILFGVYKYSDKPADSQGIVASLDASIQKGTKMDDNQFNEALKNLSETDITNYLEDNGDITDIATLGSTIDETLLPSQEDYLLDEKTLDNYLDRIETTTLNN